MEKGRSKLRLSKAGEQKTYSSSLRKTKAEATVLIVRKSEKRKWQHGGGGVTEGTQLLCTRWEEVGTGKKEERRGIVQKKRGKN